MSQLPNLNEEAEEEREKDHPIINPELVDVLEDIPHEDPFITEYGMGAGNKDSNVDFTKSWFPESKEWKAKTFIQPSQAKALAVTRNFDQLFPMFPKLQEIQPIKDAIIDDYEKYLTSIEGMGRKQHVQILTSMFGGGPGEEDQDGIGIKVFADRDKDD